MRLTKFASALGPLRNGHPRVVEQGRTKAAEKNGKMAGSLRMEGGGRARRGIKGAEERGREREGEARKREGERYCQELRTHYREAARCRACLCPGSPDSR